MSEQSMYSIKSVSTPVVNVPKEEKEAQSKHDMPKQYKGLLKLYYLGKDPIQGMLNAEAKHHKPKLPEFTGESPNSNKQLNGRKSAITVRDDAILACFVGEVLSFRDIVCATGFDDRTTRNGLANLRLKGLVRCIYHGNGISPSEWVLEC